MLGSVGGGLGAEGSGAIGLYLRLGGGAARRGVHLCCEGLSLGLGSGQRNHLQQAPQSTIDGHCLQSMEFSCCILNIYIYQCELGSP